ncbi:MAG: DegT/DnrJ/EryC1/StrS family aminotransferase, partial [Syntrophales bacterium]
MVGKKRNEAVIEAYENNLARLIGPGYGISFAACRMAFYSLLRVLGVGSGDEVILPGYTCSVMPNAVWRAGAAPVFSDIDPGTLGSDPTAIERRITSRTKVIVAQHSFGIPCAIQDIAKIGRERSLTVVEDCAITLDSSFKDEKVGNFGDAAIFSTDHTKPMNTLIGGFLYTRKRELYKRVKEFSDGLPELSDEHQKWIFEELLFERKYYRPNKYARSSIVRKLRSWRRKSSLPGASSPFLEADYSRYSAVEPYPYPAGIPAFLAQLGLFEIERWPEERTRRKAMLDRYLEIAASSWLRERLPGAYFDAALDIVPLRFVYTLQDATGHLNKMSRYLDTGSTWFRKPIICCEKGLSDIGYEMGSCETAEEIANQVINWPCVVEEGWEDKI